MKSKEYKRGRVEGVINADSRKKQKQNAQRCLSPSKPNAINKL